MEKMLVLKTYVDGGSGDTPFPNSDNPIEIGSFRYDAKRMGGAPTITASVNYPSCLDNQWTDSIYAEFRGEKFFLKQTPTSSYDNEDTMYEHQLTLVSERAILDNVLFYDAVVGDPQGEDKPVSNSTKFVFFGTIDEFAKRLNASLQYAKLQEVNSEGLYVKGYRVIVDEGITSEAMLVSFEDQYFSNAIQESYNTFKVPYYFVGKDIHFGNSNNVIEREFAYGVDDALLSITKNNSNNKIVNRVTGKGSSENIPYYYPNSSPKGEIEISTTGSLSKNDLALVDKDKFTRLHVDKKYTFKGDYSLNTIEGGVNMPSLQQSTPFRDGTATVNKLYIEDKSVDLEVRYDLFFDTETATDIELSWELTNQCNPGISMTPPLKTAWGKDHLEVKFENLIIKAEGYNRGGSHPTITEKHTYYESITSRKDQTDTGRVTNKNIDKGIKFSTPNLRGNVTVIVKLKLKTLGNFWSVVPDFLWGENSKKKPYSDIVFTSTVNTHTTGGWKTEDGVSVNMDNYGVKFLENPKYGDSFKYSIVKYITPSTNLLPPIYRNSDGAERFYNAVNGKYKDEEGNDIEFNNPWVEGQPKEHIISVEDIKPTIKEVENASGLRIDMFSEFAYNDGDNDETYVDENGETFYKHPYFFGKLRVLDFNLFECANENQAMTISFTSGNCGACNFEIGATEDYPQQNPVQVDDNGNLVKHNGMVVCGLEGVEGQSISELQPRQQDTSKYEVWIALRKEEETYGTLMPTAPTIDDNGDEIGGHRPKACTSATSNDGDTFVILGINLPEAYIDKAEEKLEAEIIKYMKDNNDEKFNFSITLSRIFFAENPTILEQLTENASLYVRYNGVSYPLYVSSISCNMNEGDALPEVRVELVDSLSVSQNAIQQAVSQVKVEMGNALANLDVLTATTPYFIRKDIDSEARGTVNFTKGIKFGEGGKVEVLDNNSAKLTIEYLEVTKKATFTSLEIQEKTHVGGQMLVTPASMNCGEVEELEDAYRCYFQTKGEDGEEIFNQFAVNDQAICQTFNAWGSRYYWRLVTGIGEDYIDLSKTDCDSGSDIPMAGDKIIQLGNRDNEDRQNAIVIAAHGDNSPYIVQYKGIVDYDLPKMDDDARITTLLSPTKNILTGQVRMEAGSKGLELFEEWAETNELISSKVSNEDFGIFKSGLEKSLEGFQKQIDGAIETWFYDPEPTLENEPAVDWIVDDEKDEKANHLGDLYYSKEGKAYRFQYNEDDGVYYWNLIEDEDITKALGLAQQAKDTADGKRRVFLENPYPPYDRGDLWSRGSTLPMMICVTSKNEEEEYNLDDWDFADNANNLATEIAGYEYIKKAIVDGETIVTGGLIQSGLLMLGYKDDNDEYHIMSGTNGVYDSDKASGGIAAWYGGEMTEEGDNRAKAVIRFDGSGYFANGNFTWNNEGEAEFAGGGIKVTKEGSLVLGNKVQFGADTTTTVGDISSEISDLISMFALDNDEISTSYKFRVNNDLIVEGDVSSGGSGQNPSASGTVIGVKVNNEEYKDVVGGILDLTDAFNNIDVSSQLEGTVSRVTALETSVSNKANKATTLSGYGITDAKIVNGVITLGNTTITPLTSHTNEGWFTNSVTNIGLQNTDVTSGNSVAKFYYNKEDNGWHSNKKIKVEHDFFVYDTFYSGVNQDYGIGLSGASSGGIITVHNKGTWKATAIRINQDGSTNVFKNLQAVGGINVTETENASNEGTSGVAGVFIRSEGGIELSHSSTPYIDFHANQGTEDFTIRITAAVYSNGAKQLNLHGATAFMTQSDANIGSSRIRWNELYCKKGDFNDSLNVSKDATVGGNLVVTGDVSSGGTGQDTPGGGGVTEEDVEQYLTNYVNSITTTGSGNVISSVSKSGKIITFTKGITALTSHQSLQDLLGSSPIGSTSAYPYWTGSAWATKTLGARAFDDTAYLPISGGTIDGDFKVNGTTTLQTVKIWNGGNTVAEIKIDQSSLAINKELKLTNGGEADIATSIAAAFKTDIAQIKTLIANDVYIGASSGTTSNLAFNIKTYQGVNSEKPSYKATVFSVDTSGKITNATWNGTPIANAYLANSAMTIAGSSVSLGGSIAASTITTAQIGSGNSFYHSGNANLTSVAWKCSSLTMGGALSGATTGSFSSTLTAKKIIISSTSSEEQLKFSRGGANSVVAVANGYFRFLSNGKSVSGGDANADLIINDSLVRVNGNAEIRNGISVFGGTNGDYSEGLRLHAATDGWNALMFCGSDNTGGTGTSAKSWGIFTDPNSNFIINKNASNNAATYAFCNVGGNWGIGTLAPTCMLDVNGTTRVLNPSADSGVITAKLLCWSGSPYGIVFSGYPTGTHCIQVKREANNTEMFPLSLQPSGSNVFIGKTTDDNSGSKLQVEGGITAKAYYGGAKSGTGQNTSGMFRWGTFDETGGLKLQFGASSGAKLEIINSAWNKALFGVTTEGQCTVNGDLIVSGDASSGSDIRFKDVIDDVTLDINTIANAPLFTFKWNDRDDDAIHLGSSAQYWEAHRNELVSGEEFKSLNYASLGVAMGISLAKKMVELEKKVEQLENENRRLRNA